MCAQYALFLQRYILCLHYSEHRRIFKKRFPSMVKASHTRGRYGDGDHPSVRKDSSYEFVSKDASMDTSKLAGPWSTADAAFDRASRAVATPSTYVAI